MIRVMYVITDLDPGGGERQLLELIRGCNGRGFHHVVVSILDPGPLKVEFELAGARVYTLGMPRRVPSPVGLLRLLKILHQSAPDWLQCWMYHGCLLCLMVGTLAGVRRILWRIGSANLE